MSILEILKSNQADNLKVAALKEALQKETRLDLSGQALKDADAIHLAQALASNSTITELNLSYNEIRKRGVIALASALIENKTLTSLNLGFNPTDLFGFLALSEVLEKNSTLKHLNIEHTLIMGCCSYKNKIYSLEDAVAILVTTLKTNKTLISLNLAYNPIIVMKNNPFISSQMSDVFTALTINKTLKSLSISIDSQALPIFQYSLVDILFTDGSALTDLQLCGSELESDIITTIASFLENNHNLTHLDLSDTNVSKQDQAKLQGYIERNIKIIATTLEAVVPPVLVKVISDYADMPYTLPKATPPEKTITPLPPKTTAPSKAITPTPAETTIPPQTTLSSNTQTTPKQPSRLAQLGAWLHTIWNNFYQFIIKIINFKKASLTTPSSSEQSKTFSQVPNQTVSSPASATEQQKPEEIQKQSTEDASLTKDTKPKNKY